MQSERSHTRDHIGYDSNYILCLQKANPQKQKVEWWLPRTSGVSEAGVTPNRLMVSFYGDENVKILENQIDFDRFTVMLPLSVSNGV